MRKRAERLAPIHYTNRQENLPEIGKQLAYKANRVGVVERCLDPAVQKSIEVELALIGHDDRLLADLELSMVQTAQQHEAQTFYRLCSIPEVGQILALVLRSEIQDIRRFPCVQEFVS